MAAPGELDSDRPGIVLQFNEADPYMAELIVAHAAKSYAGWTQNWAALEARYGYRVDVIGHPDGKFSLTRDGMMRLHKS